MFRWNFPHLSCVHCFISFSLRTSKKIPTLLFKKKNSSIRGLYTFLKLFWLSYSPGLTVNISLPLPIWQMLQFFNNLCCFSLDLHLIIFFITGSPELGTTLQMWFHQCWVEMKNHVPRPAGTLPDVFPECCWPYLLQGCFDVMWSAC